IFFFSSRRRHTRFSRDWSSDVCSSDLFGASVGVQSIDRAVTRAVFQHRGIKQAIAAIGDLHRLSRQATHVRQPESGRNPDALQEALDIIFTREILTTPARRRA